MNERQDGEIWSDLIDRTQAELVSLLQPVGTVVTLRAGVNLFLQGDPANALFALLSGRLEVSLMSENGRNMVLNVLGPGEVFGEIALFDHGRRTATVTALEDARVLRVGARSLTDEMRRNPDLGLDLLRLAVARARWVTEQMENLAFAPLNIRLARRLLFLLRTIGSADGGIGVSQAALGDHVSATREAVSKILSQWKREGIVDIARGRLVVLDADSLRSMAALPLSV